MKFKMFCLTAVLAFTTMGSSLTLAQETVTEATTQVVATVADPQTVDQAFSLIPLLIDAAKNSNYLLAAAFLTLILVFFIRKYLIPKWAQKEWSPLVSQFVGLLVAVALIVVGGASQQQATLALFAGPAASVFWSTVVKYFLQKYLPKAA